MFSHEPSAMLGSVAADAAQGEALEPLRLLQQSHVHWQRVWRHHVGIVDVQPLSATK